MPTSNPSVSQCHHSFQTLFSREDHNTTPLAIQVVEIKRLQNAGKKRAVARIRYAGLTIDGVGIIEEPGKAPYITFPSQSYTVGDRRHYESIVTWGRDLGAAIEAVVLDAYLLITLGGGDEHHP